MKDYAQFIAEMARKAKTDVRPIDESDDNVIHLKPHGKDGMKFKVMHDVGPKGEPHLKKGEIIHDTHIDDLHDSGYETKIHEDIEYFEEGRGINQSSIGDISSFIRTHASDIGSHVSILKRAHGGQESVIRPKLEALEADLHALKKKHGIVD